VGGKREISAMDKEEGGIPFLPFLVLNLAKRESIVLLEPTGMLHGN
jgi:hypothetical protein